MATYVEESVAAELEEACQSNGWLKRGGFPWQDDPFMGDYPYTFTRACDLESLKSYFTQGNHAIREGVVIDDLAFIQQENDGDEWWTLKRFDDGWLHFESISFNCIIDNAKHFECLIGDLRAATKQECKSLSYSGAAKRSESQLSELADNAREANSAYAHPDRSQTDVERGR